MEPDTAPRAFSLVGHKFAAGAGILELMDDLGRAMTLDPHMRMLGGGNPAAVPEMQRLIRGRMREMVDNGDTFDRMMANYDPPQGNPLFIEALAELLRNALGWKIGPRNIAITSGGQSAFFYLFSLLAGQFNNGRRRKILLPLAPEYIGYADQGLAPELFVACRPEVTWPEGEESRIFKYRIDFNAVEEVLRTDDVGAIAVSRPTNPSGNVLTDDEVRRLSDMAQARGIPLIIDNAYGAPFPGVLFVPALPFWAPHTILTMSLSKLGLPGTRTGIVIASEKIIAAIASFTAIVGLANGNIGQQIALPWVTSGKVLEFGPRILRPFYESRRTEALRSAREAFGDSKVNWALHANEGAFFFWLWLRNLKVTSRDLYERLKARKVLTVPGEYFYYGLAGDWPQARQCLRLNYSGPPQIVREAFRIIAEEAARLS